MGRIGSIRSDASATAWSGDSIGPVSARRGSTSRSTASRVRQRGTTAAYSLYLFKRRYPTPRPSCVEIGRYPTPEYRGLTYSTFFGLLACTGMRLSEAINLQLLDITADGLVIRNTKFRKSRLIPLHPTAQAVLERYLPKRRLFAPFDDHIFVSSRKHKLLRHDAYVAFRKSIEKIGLQRHSGLPQPTIHALRHTFAVRALETCPDDRDRITRHMIALSTYLGHSDIKHTYWYLEATPELMRNIAESTQRYFMGGGQ